MSRLITLQQQQHLQSYSILISSYTSMTGNRILTYPATSLTISLTNVVLLLARPFVLEMRGLGWWGVTFYKFRKKNLVSMGFFHFLNTSVCFGPSIHSNHLQLLLRISIFSSTSFCLMSNHPRHDSHPSSSSSFFYTSR